MTDSNGHCNGLRPSLAFLSALWPDPPPGWLLIWLKAGKRSLWFPASALAETAAAAGMHAAHTDVYVGCGLSPRNNGPTRRCDATDISAIAGVWADVDIQGEAHTKNALPPDAESAIALIQEMPRPASLIVHSGHGLQPWWLLDHPWIFASDDERKRAARLVALWQGHLRKLAACRGWTLDSTQDLARVLRLPGTTNHKGEPVPVTLDLIGPVPRYSVADLEGSISKTIPRARKPSLTTTATVQDDHSIALSALAGLNAGRAVDYDSWLAVGMVLHTVDASASMCAEWETWSRLSIDNYEEGACAAKWKTFDSGGKLCLGTLIHWAIADGWRHPYSSNNTANSQPAAPAIDPDVAAEQLTHAVLETLRARPPLARTLLEIIRGAEKEGQPCAL